MLDPQTINRIKTLFDRQRWDYTTNAASAFDRFCGMMEVLLPAEQDMLLGLSDKFLWVSMNDYPKMFADAFSCIPAAMLQGYKKIFFIPAVVPGEESSSGSSMFLVYHFKDEGILQSPPYSAYPISVIFEASSAVKGLDTSESLYIFIDDFIGSGRQSAKAVIAFMRNNSVVARDIFVLAMVAQKQSITRLASIGVNAFARVIRDKGISDDPVLSQRLLYTNLMQTIEQRLRVSRSYQFGFRRAEALVKMINTPNSTFPVYWTDLLVNATGKPTAPFARAKG